MSSRFNCITVFDCNGNGKKCCFEHQLKARNFFCIFVLVVGCVQLNFFYKCTDDQYRFVKLFGFIFKFSLIKFVCTVHYVFESSTLNGYVDRKCQEGNCQNFFIQIKNPVLQSYFLLIFKLRGVL